MRLQYTPQHPHRSRRERRTASSHSLLVFREQAPGVLKQRTGAAVTFRHVTQVGGKKVEVVLNVPSNALTGHLMHPTRRQLDGER